MKLYTFLAIIWVSVAMAVSVSCYITQSAAPLWAFLIPAMIGFKTDNK